MDKYIVVSGVKVATEFVPETFGRLTTVGSKFRLPVGKSKKQWQVCECVCGVVVLTHRCSLVTGRTTSCGCRQRDIVGDTSRTHGMSGTLSYWQYHGMLARCYDPNHVAYPDYGGRGIGVWPDWNCPGGFERWYAYMGVCPPGMSIDRYPNKDGNYEPGNVRWATQKEQANNTRRNVLITYQGKTQTRSQWAEELGISVKTLTARMVKLQWSIEKVLSTPARKCKRKDSKDE